MHIDVPCYQAGADGMWAEMIMKTLSHPEHKNLFLLDFDLYSHK